MPMATIRAVGDGLYHIHFLDAAHGPGSGGGGVDPGYGHGGVRPDRPDQGLPGGGHISNRPPMNPNFPNNSLPNGPPPHVPDGTVVVLVKDPAGVWHYASLPPGTPSPAPLPEPTPEPKPA